jgi:hypothetical protein
MDIIKPGYTRVSTILQQWDTYGHIDQDVLQNKCRIGTNVHEAIAGHGSGIYTPLDCVEEGYFASYLKWAEAVKPTYIQSEQRYYCDDMHITGQIDAIIKMPGDERPMLLDYKTSAAESPKMWPLQACYYYYLCVHNGLELSPRLLFLQLQRNGDVAKIYEYTYSQRLWQVCVAAWTTYRYLNPEG